MHTSYCQQPFLYWLHYFSQNTIRVESWFYFILFYFFARFICQMDNYVQSEDGYLREETQAFLIDINIGLTVAIDQLFPWYHHVFMCV